MDKITPINVINFGFTVTVIRMDHLLNAKCILTWPAKQFLGVVPPIAPQFQYRYTTLQ